MPTKLQRWGNSQGVRLSKTVLEQAGMTVGDDVSVTIEDGAIVLRRTLPTRTKIDLAELVKLIPTDYQPQEVDWGSPTAGEEW